MSPPESRDRARVRIPADVERPDRLLGNLTARQLAILAAAAVLLWAAYIATRHLVPLALFAAAACPLAAVATVLALGRVEGQPADRLAAAAWRHWRAPRRLVPAPEGVEAPPAWVTADPGPLPAPLRLPLGGIAADGTLDLGGNGLALLCRASSVTFSLRTPLEQEALTAGFARFLNSLGEPIQLVVRAEPVELSSMVERLLDAAPGLPHLGLEEAARDHARFLNELGSGRRLLRREVLVVLRQPAAAGAAAESAASESGAEQLRRRAAEATSALGAAGVTLTVLDGPAATACLSRALDPYGPFRPDGTAAPDEIVTRGEKR